MSWEVIKYYLESWFNYSGLEGYVLLIAIGVALIFGGIWIAFYRQPRFTNLWPLAVLVFSAFFTVVAISVVQIPLQYYINEGMINTWDWLTINDWLLLAGIPIILLYGLVQEGAKMVPIVVWWRGRKDLDPKLGLAIGALAGFGFGVFQSFNSNAYALYFGYDWQMIINNGFSGILPYWQTFFFTGLGIATSALAGYGLAKGRGWQFYLIAAGLNSLMYYSFLIYQKEYFTDIPMAIYIAAVAVLVTIVVLWLRYRKGTEEPLPPIEPPAPVETDV
jgi:hypothetical protein